MENKIGNRLRMLRKAKKLTQEDLSQKIGLSLSSIKSYETGVREPNSKAMAALEQYFVVSGAYLRGEEMSASEAAEKMQQIYETTSSTNSTIVNVAVKLMSAASVQEQRNVNSLLTAYFGLSSDGQFEMLKRMQEYKCMEDARGAKASSSKQGVG